MMHDDMTLARLIVYVKSIEESKLTRMDRSLIISCSSDQEQTSFFKRAQTQVESNSTTVTLEKGVNSQKFKHTCEKCGKKHYGECLLDTGSFFGCGKEENKVRGCHTITSSGREGKHIAPTFPKDTTKRHFYALRSRIEKPEESDDDVGKFSLSF